MRSALREILKQLSLLGNAEEYLKQTSFELAQLPIGLFRARRIDELRKICLRLQNFQFNLLNDLVRAGVLSPEERALFTEIPSRAF